MDEVAWGALAGALALVGATWTWHAWRRRGFAAGLRGLAWTLLPVAAYLTGTLELLADIVDAFATYGARLVFSPVVWLGVVVAGVSGVLFVVSGAVSRVSTRDNKSGAVTARPPKAARAVRGPDLAGDDGMDEIEEILRRRGIS